MKWNIILFLNTKYPTSMTEKPPTKLVNNWKCAKVLEEFKQQYMDPHDVEVKKAFEILNDPNHKWTDDKQKTFATLKYQRMDTLNINYAKLSNAIKALIMEHEHLVDVLALLYGLWYDNVAYEGLQQKEMMQGQANVLQDIFTKLYEILEPLGLTELKPPYDYEKSHTSDQHTPTHAGMV